MRAKYVPGRPENRKQQVHETRRGEENRPLPEEQARQRVKPNVPRREELILNGPHARWWPASEQGR